MDRLTERSKRLAECLELADEMWSDLFLGDQVRQSEYNAMSDAEDSREILGYRSAAVTQLAITLFQQVIAEDLLNDLIE